MPPFVHMGLFSKKRTYVGSTSVKLLADTPDTVLNSVVASVAQGGNIADDLVANMVDGTSLKARAAVNYAKNSYYLGLPQGALEYGAGSDVLVIPILNALLDKQVSILYNVVDLADPHLLSAGHLLNTRDWDETTNIVSNPITVPPVGSSAVTLKDAVFSGNPDEILITYDYTDDQAVPQTQSETISVPGLEEKGLYYHVAYVTLDATGTVDSETQYWSYKVSSGLYPQLDALPEVAESPYYPVVPLRRHNVDITREENRNSAQYLTSRTLLKKLGIDILNLAEGINANPDIAEIDHAFVYFGVDISTTAQSGLKYLYEYFNYMAGKEFSSKADFDAWEAGSQAAAPPMNRIKIQDSDLRIDIGYLYIETDVVVGNIGKVNFVDSIYTPETDLTATAWTTVEAGDDYIQKPYTVYLVNSDRMTFRKQITPTTYATVMVRGLNHISHVYGSHTVDTTLVDAQDPDNSAFMIPLNRFVVGRLTLKDENELMYEATAIMFNSYKTVKAKWYQTGFFKFAMIVVAVAATIMAPWTGGSGMQAALAIGMTAGTTAIVIMAVMLNLVIAFTVSKLFEILVKEIGMQNALILAVLLVVASIANKGVPGSTSWIPGAPTAAQLLQVSNGLLAGVSSAVEDEMSDLIDAKGEFEDYSKEEMSRLEAANDLLETSGIIDPWDYIANRPDFILDETPDEFYTRTIHSGNIGVAAIDAIGEYVNLQLQLPTTNATIGA